MTKKILGVAGITALALLPLLAGAQSFVDPGTATGQNVPGAIGELFQLIRRINNYFLTGVIVVAGVMIVYAGWTYMTAAGDPSKFETAKTTIIYAVVGVGVALLAQLIVAVAAAIVGAK